nr:hypothetical protein [Desulfobacterales bacterium]
MLYEPVDGRSKAGEDYTEGRTVEEIRKGRPFKIPVVEDAVDNIIFIMETLRPLGHISFVLLLMAMRPL